MAPELPNAIEAIRVLKQQDVLVAVGHTAASLSVVTDAVQAGARLVTHVFNAMAGIHHREPGPAVAALVLDDLTVSMIADGVHLHPAILSLIRRAKGPERCVLVTDRVAVPSVTMTNQGPPATPDGVLAGTQLRMDEAIAQTVSAGFTLEEAVGSASAVPARLLGLADRGVLQPGYRADLVLLDDHLHVTDTWVAEDWQ